MTVVAVVPARGGSKGLPGKNLAEVAGRSLVERAVESCRRSRRIDAVVVSTDDRGIADAAEAAGASIVWRPAELAGDTASSESALLHAIQQLGSDEQIEAGPGRPDVVVLVQCTSPFISPDDLDRAVGTVESGRADVVFSAVPMHGFVWRRDGHGGLVGVNHSADHRPRRQEREPEYLETGAFYVMRTDGFVQRRHRFFGRVEAEVVDRLAAVEIDDQVDLDLARQIRPLLESDSGRDATSAWGIDRIDALVTDFDGVHTDNAVYVSQDGHELVRADRSDGLGISALRAEGVPLLVLSTERNPVVLRRAEKLQVECIAGCDDKAAALGRWLELHGHDPRHVIYVGNDVNDLGCLQMVGWPIAVADAHPDVLAVARVVTDRRGGHGAVREVVDQVLAVVAAPGRSSAEPNESNRSETLEVLDV